MKKKLKKEVRPKKKTPLHCNFKSLDVMKRIIATENKFRLQIITLESQKTFLNYLESNSIYVNVVVNGSFSKKAINLVFDSCETKCERVILFNNRREPSYIQLVFKPTLEEVKSAVSDDYLVECYKYKNIEHLLNIKEGYELKINELMKDCVDYVDSVILITVFRYSKFKDIVKNVSLMDSSLDNVFLIKTKVNSLVERNILCCYNNDSYRINISNEVLDSICANVGFNLKLI